MRMAEQTQVEIKYKFCLTIDEASAYFNIGEKKLSRIVTDNIDERANVKTDGMRSNTLMPQASSNLFTVGNWKRRTRRHTRQTHECFCHSNFSNCNFLKVQYFLQIFNW